MPILLILFSYLLGAIPFGLIIAKQKKKDLRKIGSGNIGATNVYRATGIKSAAIVGFLDFAKGVLPTYLATLLFPNQETITFTALAAVLGHIFPVYLKFHGGKGVATFAGTLLILFEIKIFLLLLLIWLIILSTIRIMSLSNLLISLTTPIISFFILHSQPYLYYTLLTTLLILYTHRKNISKLYHHT